MAYSNLLSAIKGGLQIKAVSLQLQGVQGTLPPEANGNSNNQRNHTLNVSTVHQNFQNLFWHATLLQQSSAFGKTGDKEEKEPL